MRMHCDRCAVTRDATDIFGNVQGDCPNCGAPMTGTSRPVAGLAPDLVRWANIPTRQLADAIEVALAENPGFIVYAARWVDEDPEIPWISDREGHWRLTLIQPARSTR